VFTQRSVLRKQVGCRAVENAELRTLGSGFWGFEFWALSFGLEFRSQGWDKGRDLGFRV